MNDFVYLRRANLGLVAVLLKNGQRLCACIGFLNHTRRPLSSVFVALQVSDRTYGPAGHSTASTLGTKRVSRRFAEFARPDGRDHMGSRSVAAVRMMRTSTMRHEQTQSAGGA
jgi:hypothetical protein